MSKAVHCALAMLIGAMIGGTAPDSRRGDAVRYATIATSDPASGLTVALANRPRQGD